ncbi:MAG: metallophosphoesterase [Actinomycetota bacterium]|nr:metallophosphoesterase [Actinomycetota bacterium]
MRTLVISDLHLGNRGHRDVLRQDIALRRLLAALDDVQRLVLLGDVLEFHGRHAERALTIAEPTLREIGARMGGKEIVLLPGNHDHDLIGRWIRARGDALGLADAVPSDASPALARVVAALSPATVRVSYPGVWLQDGIYAIHGQYADRHLHPQSATGLLRRETPRPMTPARYERRAPRRVRRRRSGSVRSALGRARRQVRAVILFELPSLLLRPRLAPLIATGLDVQMRRSALPAFARVITGLGIQADWVLFGHVHRLGPCDGDNPRLWRVAGNGAQIINTGSWQYETLLAGQGEPPHPYWPGGAVLLEPGRPPRVLGLLDDLRRADLDPGER